ncbi:MFS transporter [Verrucomicrobia bacterium]|nr:MFS transporter [Verrucomicrobiota bacterium]
MKSEKASVSTGETDSGSETEKGAPLITRTTAGPFSALAHRNYRIFFGSQILSLPGTWLQLVAEGWLVYEITGSALALGLIRFLHTIPVTLLSVAAGGLADRYDKRRVLVITQSVAMIVAFVLFLLTYKGNVQVWQLSCLALVLGIANAFDIPTRQSFIVDLVGRPDLMNAIALNSSVFNSARIVGPAIAGILISTVGVAYCFLLNSISFLFVLLGYCSLSLAKKKEVTEGEKKDRGIGAAFRVVMATPSLRQLMGMTALTSVFGMSYTTLMPIFAEDDQRKEAHRKNRDCGHDRSLEFEFRDPE